MKRPAGHASIEEHPKGSGRYRVRPRINGKLTTIGSDLSEADALALAAAHATVRNAGEVKRGITVAQFGPGFLDRRELAGVRSMRTDRSSWKTHIAGDPLGALAVATLERRDVVEWRDRLKGAHRTRVRNLNLLRVALDEAVERGLLPSNPARAVKIHRASAATAKDDLEGILSPVEQQRLMAAVPARERPLVVFALCTGLRQAEQWWLHWEDVEGATIVVRRSKGGLPPKSGKPREVPLLPPAIAALAELRSRKRSGVVFRGARGSKRQEGKAPLLWSRWVEAAGIKRHIRWHDLRHTCATSLLAGWWGRKWTLDEVCKLLGHSSIMVTERYARKLNETLKHAVSGTPMLMFPSGNTEGPIVAKSLGERVPFVKHRSSVQVRQSAPVLTSGDGEHVGNIFDPGWMGPSDPPVTSGDFAFLQSDLGGVARG